MVSRGFSVLAAFGGGALAAFSILESAANDYDLATEQGIAGVLVTPQWAGTVAAVTAVVALTVLMHVRSRMATATAVVAGVIAIGLPDVVDVATRPANTLNAVGAGLLLAGTAYPAVERRARVIALATGVLTATMFFGMAGMWRAPAGRWAVSLWGEFHVPATLPLPVLTMAVIVLGTVALTTHPVETEAPTRSVATGVVLPVVFLVLYATLGSTASGTASWTVAVVLAVAATFWAAWRLPQSTRQVLLLGLAFAAVTVNQVHYYGGAEWWLLGGLPLIAGLVVGWRYPRVSAPVGMAMLVVITASGLLPLSLYDLVTLPTYALVLPGALGLCASSILPTAHLDPPLVLTAAMLPLTMTFFAVSAPQEVTELVWSGGHSTSQSTFVITATSPHPIGIVVATVTAAAAALAVVRLRSREPGVGDEVIPESALP